MNARPRFQVWVELSLRALGVFSITAALLPVVAAGLLAGPERNPRVAMSIAMPIGGLLVMVLMYQAAQTVQRAESLVRALSRGPIVTLDRDTKRAAFAVYDATYDAAWRGFVALLLALAWEAAYGTLSGAAWVTRLPVLVLVGAFYQLAVYLTAQSFRSGLHAWVVGIRPGLLRPYRRSLLHRRFGLRIVSAMGCFAGTMVAALVSHGVGAAEVGNTPLVLSTVAIAMAVGVVTLAAWQIGYDAATDVRRLHEWVRQLATERWTRTEQVPELPMRNRAAQALSHAVSDLAKDFAGMTAAEVAARRSVEQAERLKTRFLTYMSHDLRGPINAIRGFSDLLARGTEGPLNDEQLESVRIVRASGDDLASLVTDVIDWSRLEAGRLDLRLERIPIVTLLEGVHRRVAPSLSRRGIALSLELGPGLAQANVDQQRIEQAITALVEFLSKHMADGEIVLSAVVRSDRTVFELSPVTPLPALASDAVFRPFLDTRDAAGRRIGLSLGPALAKAFVEAHGGRIRCEGGGRFEFSLPLDLRPVRTGPVSERPSPGPSTT